MSDTQLSHASRLAVLAGGLLSAFALYMLAEHVDLFDKDRMFALVTAGFFGGHSLMLLAHRGPLLRAGLYAAALAVALGLIAWQYAVHVGYAAGLTDYGDAMADFCLSVWFAYFLIVTFIQAWYEAGWPAPYESLFRNAWHNVVLALLPGPLVGLVFAALWLAAALFNLIGLDFLERLLQEEWFGFELGGLLYALVIVYLREQDRIMGAAMRFGLAMFRIVGLVLCVAAIAFLLCLPVVGLDALWNSRLAASILMGIALVSGFYINAYVEAGDGGMWQAVGRARRLIVTAAVVTLPVFVLMAAYAFYLRIGDYGWTPDRVYAVPVIGLGLLCALAYLVQVIRFRMDWVHHAGPVNIAIAAAAIVAALTIQLAPLSAYTIAAKSQVARLQSGQVKADDFDFAALKFRTGAPGREAFDKLTASDETLKALGYTGDIKLLRENANPWDRPSAPDVDDNSALEIDFARFTLVPEDTALTPSEAKALKAGIAALPAWLFNFGECMNRYGNPDGHCYLWAVDMDADGAREYLFMAQIESFRQSIMLRQVPGAPGRWAAYRLAGDWSSPVDFARLVTEGRARFARPTLPDLMLDDEQIQFQKSGEHGTETGERP